MTYQFISSAKLPTKMGEFQIHGFNDKDADQEHVALSIGNWDTNTVVPIRIHSECLTGDSLFSTRCDCGFQLEKALASMAKNGVGVVLYLRQEGRGIGLLNKIKAYKLQDSGMDTVEANNHLGFDADLRDYGICQFILGHLNISKVSLMTNNPKKIAALESQGVEVTERLPIDDGTNPDNLFYMQTKVEKMGHQIEFVDQEL